jgi:hypothetical protein
MLWSLLLRHIHTALRPAPVLHADTHLGRLWPRVVAHHAQPAIAALGMECLDSGLGQAVVFNGLSLGVTHPCTHADGRHRQGQQRYAPRLGPCEAAGGTARGWTGGAGMLHSVFLGKSGLRVGSGEGGIHSLTFRPVVLPKSTGSSAGLVASSWLNQSCPWLGGRLAAARLVAALVLLQLTARALLLVLACTPELITT